MNVYTLAFTNKDGKTNIPGALAMTVMLLINLFFAGFSSMTVTSRIGFAMVRDKALPFSGFLYKINEKTKTPYRIIFLVFISDVLLCLLPLVNELAFAAVTSITTIGY